MTTIGYTYVVDAVCDGVQVADIPAVGEGNAYAAYDKLCGVILSEGEGEITTRLIHNGTTVAEQTSLNGRVLDGFDGRLA